MTLSDLEQLVFAYYVANGALDLDMVPRFWPYGELVLIIEDKMQLATRAFGFKVRPACTRAAREFLDTLIKGEGFATVESSLGGTMHRYQAENYKSCIKQLMATNRILLKAQGAGPSFWQEEFARLSV